ncbi:MAG TPA: LuxR C-terminal-related transcriptional regulator, partial [Acidimicrobiales bacterium]|nr:LuxR C-terminal-related transcriptional regulator [Acidimicrobiales bacterium]
ATAADSLDARVVAEICQRLDGMPLAIELAAARMRVLTAEQIRDGLRDRFRLLTGGARTAMPRQQTLQASVDWSYALLLAPERTLLHRLSVFAGGFTLDAAAAVGAGGELEAHHVFDLLMQLVDKSLVYAADDANAGRFGLLETVRQYAASKLVDSGEAEAVRRRHFDYFFEFARRGVDALDVYRDRLDADYDNLRRALQWADDHADASALVRMAAHLYGYWALGRRLDEGDQWLRRAVDRADSSVLRGRVLGHYAHIHGMAVSWQDATPVAAEALELARASGNAGALTWSLAQYANALSNVLRGEEAVDALHEAIAIAREHDDAHGLAFALFQLGRVQTILDPVRAEAILGDAIAAADRAGAPYIRHMARACTGWSAEALGDLRAAAANTEEAVAGLLDIGDGWFTASVLAFLAHIRALSGDDAGATAALEELATIATEMGGAVRPMTALGRGLVAFVQGEWDAAAAYLSEMREPVDVLIARAPLVLSLIQTGDFSAAERHSANAQLTNGLGARTLELVRGELVLAKGDDASAREHFRAYLLGNESLIYGSVWGVHALRRFARTSLAVGQADEALRLLAAASARADAMGVSPTTAFVMITDGDERAVAASFDASTFERLWRDGAAMSWDSVLAYLARGRGARSRPATGWEALTPTERQVVDLVVEGLPNKAISEKLFMSLATVKSHLTHAYAKLGVSSRRELLAGAARGHRPG